MKTIQLTLLYSITIFLIINPINGRVELPRWEDNTIKIEDPTNQSPNSIDSYIINNETTDKLYLGEKNGTHYLYLNGNMSYLSNDNISSITPPLMKYNNLYYFCSSKQIIKLNTTGNNEPEMINGPEKLNGYDNWKLKCFKHFSKVDEFALIVAAFIGTPYVCFYNLKTNEWGLCDGNEATILHSINALEKQGKEERILMLINLYNVTNSENISIIVNRYKLEGSSFESDSFSIQPSEENGFIIYDNLEVMRRDELVYIFTFEKYEENKNQSFRFYQIKWKTGLFYLNGGIDFLPFFLYYKIISINFIENLPLAYYLIQSQKFIDQYYIGVIDLDNLILLYNTQVDGNIKISFDYGNFYNNKGFFNYFKTIDDKVYQIKICPFIYSSSDDKCIFILENGQYFTIKNNTSGNNYNSISNCEDGKIMGGKYCVEECSLGYQNNGEKECQKCNFDQQYFLYGSKKCIAKNVECVNEKIMNVCYDCKAVNKIYFETDCISNCSEIYGEDDNNGSCIKCIDKNEYFDTIEHKCIDDCEYGAIIDITNECIFCYKNNSFLFDNVTMHCVNECPKFFYIEKEKQCTYCNNRYFKYTNNTPGCSNKCPDLYGVKKEGIWFKKHDDSKKTTKDAKYCYKCSDDEVNPFYEENGNKQSCVAHCDSGYSTDIINKKCIACGKGKYYNGGCVDECPIYTIIETNEQKCTKCLEGQYFYNNSCSSTCEYPLFNNISDDGYLYCAKCEEGKTNINNKCTDTCPDDCYRFSETECNKCFCASKNDTCYNNKSQCICSDNEYYYGYSCEFYSLKGKISEKNMTIISLNNKFVKSEDTFLTYNIINDINKNYKYKWSFYVDNETSEDITNNSEYKKYFITGNNEKIFGIKKDSSFINDKIYVGLLISDINNNTLYSDEIMIYIMPFDKSPEIAIDRSSNMKIFTMDQIYGLETTKFDYSDNGRYFFQFNVLDYFYEELPLNSYGNIKNIKTFLPHMHTFTLNVKNDRGEKLKTIFDFFNMNENCSSCSLDAISKNNSITMTEKIFKYMAYFKEHLNTNETDLEAVNEFLINKTKEIINENGYYIENNITNNDDGRQQIIYSEPKTIFSLLNFIINSQKITENNIKQFYKYFSIIFEKLNEIKSNNTNSLSETDILSLFRALDKLSQKVFENNLEIDKNVFFTILQNMTEYISTKTYPGESVKLLGKYLTLINYHFGEHQNIISFPYFEEFGKTDNDDFRKYSYDNYYLNGEICNQTNSTIFCINSISYTNIIQQFKKLNLNINDALVNIYIIKGVPFEDLNNNNHNYSTMVKIYDISQNKYIDLELNDNFNFIYDFELPFKQKKDESEEEDENYVFLEINNEESSSSISIYPNYSNISCVPKNYNKKSDKIFCTTHFNYKNNTIRCSCNVADEIILVNDFESSNFYKNLQFQKTSYKYFNKYTIIIYLIIILFILIPALIFLFTDINKDKTLIKNDQPTNLQEDDRKNDYKQIRQYHDVGILAFAFYLTLTNFPYFSSFSRYKYHFPKYLKHLVICVGITLGIVISLIPFTFLSFTEKQNFIDKRDIEKFDEQIKEVKSNKYYIHAAIFGVIGLILTNLFIYIFKKLLNYEKDEIEFWTRINNMCINYINNEIKTDVLLGNVWAKIKYKINAYYLICGKYILNSVIPRNKNRNKIFEKYLIYTNRELEKPDHISKFTMGDLDAMLPIDTDPTISSISKDINTSSIEKSGKPYKQKNTVELEDKKTRLLDDQKIDNDDENMKIDDLDKSNQISEYAYKDSICFSRKVSDMRFISSFLQIKKTGDFYITKKKSNKNLLTEEELLNFERIKNKYIYIKEKKINEIDIDEPSERGGFNQELYMIHEDNFSYYAVDSFLEIRTKINWKVKNSLSSFIWLTIILWGIFIVFALLGIILIKNILEKFECFIITRWILPVIIIIAFANFVLYYIKNVISSILLFNFYHLRKQGWFVKMLYSLFVDSTMLYIYKVKNYISKYKREFDYLLS